LDFWESLDQELISHCYSSCTCWGNCS